MSGMDPAILTNNGIGIRLTPSGTSSTAARAVLGTGDSLIATNPGAWTIYLVVGDSSIQAPVPGTTAGFPILPGTKEEEIVLDPTASWYTRPYVACNCESGGSGILVVQRVFR